MKRNMGNADRIIRSLVAVLILSLSFTGIIHGALGFALLAVAVVFIVTAFFATCPLYSLLGINTCSHKNKTAA
jgi:hypothetical protein